MKSRVSTVGNIPSAARRRVLQQMAVGVVGGVSGVLQQALAADLAAGGGEGIRSVSGGAVYVDGNPAAVGTPVREGSVVVTPEGAVATYVVGRDAFLQRSGTHVEIGRGMAAVFRVVTGALMGTFTPGSRRTVSTRVITAGIRGTGCYVEAELHRTYFCLCYGSVELTTINGAMRSYSTRHHDSPYWIDAAGSVTDAPVRNHEDAELALLESLTGRKVPFTGPYTR